MRYSDEPDSCECGHQLLEHGLNGTDPCSIEGCECPQFEPFWWEDEAEWEEAA